MTKDIFKSRTMIDYTEWDLNAPVHHHNRGKMVQMFHRKARRALKSDLSNMKKELDKTFSL